MMLIGAIQLASELLKNSSIAITTIKASLLFSIDSPIKDGVEHIETHNMPSLNSGDIISCIVPALNKQKPKYSKL
ncbi:hypothetical protein CONCODRAFT_2358 [Conidiobolus coronatus NRRL 28638]|uniref:Uncharacterized protein n=1 Tax=Conidiobolus coronatus (strain ATCC 28846 / CBS 209.66 / NRRL 28638) TaxID=796925 RepID=A0A137PHT9_CONC2|nr:hypothetical protein CONCODRAFT_2358 [Conidiobolus coronatus NRRL 28638]|eukprot:KXN74552.1 hypothetical protein CONCODRAFT_2358 [Conidiobolus coronatus NRRL 28638]